jgi:hypothetical protein
VKKSEEKRNGVIENNGDSDSLFSDFLDARARRAKEKLVAREVRVGHPGCFCFKRAEAIENEEDSERKRRVNYKV